MKCHNDDEVFNCKKGSFLLLEVALSFLYLILIISSFYTLLYIMSLRLHDV